jgi:hypothetical protein
MAGKVYVYGRGGIAPPEGTLFFNVTSHSCDPLMRTLSPFTLGPVLVRPYGDPYTCMCFENAWQFCKISSVHGDRDVHLQWACEGFANTRPQRFPFGTPRKPLGLMWDNELLGYVESRVRVYCPLYAAAVEAHASEAYKCLHDIVASGRDIALFDFDGYNHIAARLSLEGVLYNTRRKMGHAFVLAMMLCGERVWETGYAKEKEHATSIRRRTG